VLARVESLRDADVLEEEAETMVVGLYALRNKVASFEFEPILLQTCGIGRQQRLL
jgi:hypothetical protein